MLKINGYPAPVNRRIIGGYARKIILQCKGNTFSLSAIGSALEIWCYSWRGAICHNAKIAKRRTLLRYMAIAERATHEPDSSLFAHRSYSRMALQGLLYGAMEINRHSLVERYIAVTYGVDIRQQNNFRIRLYCNIAAF